MRSCKAVYYVEHVRRVRQVRQVRQSEVAPSIRSARSDRSVRWPRLALLLLFAATAAFAEPQPTGWPLPADLESLRTSFAQSPVDCWPHTRWWWMGNALRKEDIRFQLEEMKSHGIGGVEQITMGPVYEKGNLPYLSDEHIELLRYAVAEARALGLEFSLNFGGPGWVIGGEWVPPQDRSKNLVPTSTDVEGPRTVKLSLPTETIKTGGFDTEGSDIGAEDRLVAVVAARLDGEILDADSLTVLTNRVKSRTLHWSVPAGRWRIMAFWLRFTHQGNAVDHFSKPAMQRYCDYLGGRFQDAFGADFGSTIESLFCDSFEVGLLPGGIYWSDELLSQFQATAGYDLTPYLPAIWCDVGPLTPKVRYDVNNFLHQIGVEAFFKTFLDWCAQHGMKGRIQPYGFPTDVLEGAGMTHLPEMEITAGEKDAVPWFDTRIGPREYVSSGAHLYGRNIVTVEAYTYLHWEPYRETLEELKISSDIFLRGGANKFYNQGYTASPERDIAPGRNFYTSVHISHDNIWWRYYPLLAQYLARSCYLLRQGHPVADIAVYSPLANQWTKSALNLRKWTRSFDWGELGKLILANGYDFDLINDDVLQNRAEILNGALCVQDQSFRFLVLPDIEALPAASMQRIRDFAQQGGVVIALEHTPRASTGRKDWQQNDALVSAISDELFAAPAGREGVGHQMIGAGHVYFLTDVMHRTDMLDWRSAGFDPFIQVLQKHLPPDMGLDLVAAGQRTNEGLIFTHRVLDGHDLYFVTNVQDATVDLPITFRVEKKTPWLWDPRTGVVSPMLESLNITNGVQCRLRLAPFESQFLIFSPQLAPTQVTANGANRVWSDDGQIWAAFAQAGEHLVEIRENEQTRVGEMPVRGLPAALDLGGAWTLSFSKPGANNSLQLDALQSWVDLPEFKHFSGMARYEKSFSLPAAFLRKKMECQLDLGRVCNVAEVFINDHPAGTVWMRGQRLDITPHLHRGNNTIAIDVTNTLINRIAGLGQLPPVPEELRPIFGDGAADKNDPSAKLIGFDPLPPSGLLGPVLIHPLKRVRIEASDRSVRSD